MKRRVNKKALAALLAFVMVLFSLVSGTLAYFTDVTEEKENVFTIGKVGIELEEPAWDEDDTEAHIIMPSKKIDKDPTITVDDGSEPSWVFLKVDMNKYVSLINLMGVHAYRTGLVTGEPTEYPGLESFLGAMLNDKTALQTIVNTWIQGIDHTAWKVMNLDEIVAAFDGIATGSNPDHLIIKLGHKAVMDEKESVTFMTSYTMPADVTSDMLNDEDHSNFNSDLANFVVTFKAYAIQEEGIADLDAAYDALAKLEP